MRAFIRHSGLVVPIDRANVDTDLILPKQFLRSIKRTGFGPFLFDQIRYLDGGGEPDQDCSDRPLNPQFPLNYPRYRGASILLARANFGCGSSREHAPWALDGYGIQCLIAPSFADIFYNNCFKNGLLPIVLSEDQVDHLFEATHAEVGYRLDVDLRRCELTLPSGESWSFSVEDYRRQCLLEGLDDIGVSLRSAAVIEEYEQRASRQFPWLFPDRAES